MAKWPDPKPGETLEDAYDFMQEALVTNLREDLYFTWDDLGTEAGQFFVILHARPVAEEMEVEADELCATV
ncbi:MAG: hypothetical protein WCY86_04935 [Spirosomataceae bacterium]|jgi:hypothetical protein